MILMGYSILVQTLDRICDVFQRGKYVLVLDSLESFGRPPMVHHGIPNLDVSDSDLLSKFEGQVNNLMVFIQAIVTKAKNFKDSYTVVTIDQPRQRHTDSSMNTAFGHLSKEIQKVIKRFESSEAGVFDSVRMLQQKNLQEKGYIGFYSTSTKNDDIYEMPDDPIKGIEANWKHGTDPIKRLERSLERAEHVYYLIKLLRVQECGEFKSFNGVISAFVCFFAFLDAQGRSLYAMQLLTVGL